MPALRPAERPHCGLRGVEYALRFRADERVFAVGLVPYGNGLDAVLGKELESMKLRFGLMGEAIAHADGESFKSQHVGFERAASLG